jgi:hypothetical protein
MTFCVTAFCRPMSIPDAKRAIQQGVPAPGYFPIVMDLKMISQTATSSRLAPTTMALQLPLQGQD